MQNMQPSDIVGEYKESTLTFYGQSTRQVLTTDIEIPFPDGRLIVSRTDLEGNITHLNKSFIEMSGYTRDELLGQPHCILRHPDMPPAAFKDLWETVKAGKKWHGYVKNLRKDGGYYWVHAVVIPNIRNNETVGYTSVRRKPSRKKVEECIKLYPTLF